MLTRALDTVSAMDEEGVSGVVVVEVGVTATMPLVFPAGLGPILVTRRFGVGDTRP